MPSVTPFLWFDGRIAEAVEFYQSVFGDDASLIDSSPPQEGELFTARLSVFGQEFVMLSGGPHYRLSPAFSFAVSVSGQAEVDYYWDALSDQGEPGRCGWLVDRFGVSWQVVPTQLMELLGSSAATRAEQARQAMLTMNKLEIATLQAAYDA